LIVGYTLGTALLQIGYQAGGALTVAGLATLLTNALRSRPARSFSTSPCRAGVRRLARDRVRGR
jgi:hypothetical protein